MPLHVARLRDSDLAAEECPEACWYAVLLWAASWHQIPAASLPNNDAVLARLAGLGRDMKTWRKHKAAALRGFVLCDDGRLYHPIVAEQANDSWSRREAFADQKENRHTRQQRWRDRCKELSGILREAGIAPPRGASLATLEEMVKQLGETPSVDGVASTQPSTKASTVDAVEIGKTGTGTGTSYSEDKSSAGPTLSGDHDKDAWTCAKSLLRDQGGMSDATAGRFFGKLLRDNRIAARDLFPSIVAAMTSGTQDPKAYLTKAAAGIAARSARAAAPQRVGFV